jgi:large subunit ribosomal protein L3
MTQLFDSQGQQIPVTVVEAEPNPVMRVSTGESGSVIGFELGHGSRRTARESKGKERVPRGRRTNRAALGHAGKAGVAVAPRTLRSFSLELPSGSGGAAYKPGDRITVEIFAPGDTVKVTGTSKGRGFQGIVKRHKAGGGPNTHGNTKHRRPGSVGAGTNPSRVIKGKRMPGHYGAARSTQTHLRVEKIDVERNLIYIRGSVAGPRNGIVTVSKQG